MNMPSDLKCEPEIVFLYCHRYYCYCYYYYFLVPEKQLGTLIEGESLLNDGTAIILFNVLLSELIPGGTRSGIEFLSRE